MRCFETHGTETDYSNLSGFKEHFKKKNPTTFPGLIYRISGQNMKKFDFLSSATLRYY